MNVPNSKGVLKKYEWLIASLYQVIIIRKTTSYSMEELLEIESDETISDMQMCYNYLSKKKPNEWETSLSDEEKNLLTQKMLTEYYN